MSSLRLVCMCSWLATVKTDFWTKRWAWGLIQHGTVYVLAFSMSFIPILTVSVNPQNLSQYLKECFFPCMAILSSDIIKGLEQNSFR